MLLFPIRSNSGDEGKPTRLVVPEDRPVRPNFQKPYLRRQAAGSLRCCQPIAAPGRAHARVLVAKLFAEFDSRGRHEAEGRRCVDLHAY